MDWRSLRFDWTRTLAFLVTAEEGSLSAAARALGLTQPTVGRQVAALERELGVVLFEHVGRGLVLTPSGEALLEHARAMGAAATRLSLTASGSTQSIDGLVTITASDLLSAISLPPIVAELQRRAPRISIGIVASNGIQDLLRREADIAVRNVTPEHGDLIGRWIRDLSARLYATPACLADLGDSLSMEDLNRAAFVGFEAGAADAAARLNATLGLALTDRNIRVMSDNGVVIVELVAQGLGIGILPELVGDADPRLVRVPVDLPPATFPLWLVTHRDLRHSARIRFVYDLLAEALEAL